MAETVDVDFVRDSLGEAAGEVVESLQTTKGEQIVVLDVREKSIVTDLYMLVTGKNDPHLKALASQLSRKLKPSSEHPIRLNGTPESGWVILDLGDIVVHIFKEEMREFYNLEELWNDAKRLNVD